MAQGEGSDTTGHRQGRRWRFASAEFDEVGWTLVVDGRPVAIEAKPLEVLHELLLRAGQVVTKDELLSAVWPGVSVVEASIPMAVMKLRRALNDNGRDRAVIVTVPRLGYRLACPVEIERSVIGAVDGPLDAPLAAPPVSPLAKQPMRWGRLTALAGVALACAVAVMPWPSRAPSATPTPLPRARAFSQKEAGNAIRKLEIDKIEALLQAGWSPNTPFDDQGNGALNILLGVCEWDKGHDRRKLMLLARTLIDAGASVDSHNVWGDTAYSIAMAPRYCGPSHPVTQMLHTACYSGYGSPGDRCLAIRPRRVQPG